MYRFGAYCLAAVVLVPAMVTNLYAQRLFESDEIELRSSTRIVAYGAGTCVVSEERETAAAYEEKKAHHGQPIDIWQLNRVEAAPPPCTDLNLTTSVEPPGPVARGNADGQLLRRAHQTAPGESVTGTSYVWASRDHEPRFASWTVDYSLASAPGEDVPQDAPHGMRVIRFPNGTVDHGPYVDDRRQGNWIIRFPDGTVEEGPYVDGVRHGHWVIRFANGVLEEGPYEEDTRHGRWTVRFPNGAVEDVFYVDGKKIFE